MYTYRSKNYHNAYDNPFFIQNVEGKWLLCNFLDFDNESTCKVYSYIYKNEHITNNIQIINRQFIIRWDLVTSALTLKCKHMEYLYNVNTYKKYYK